MKHCRQCNLDFPSSYHFCGSCGGDLSESVTCAVCGEVVESRWKFCTGCGKPMASAEKSVHGASIAQAQPPTAIESRSINSAPQPTPSAPSREWYAAPELFEEADEETATAANPHEISARVPTNSDRPVFISSATSRNGEHYNSRSSKEIPTLTMLSAYGQSEPTVVRTETRNQYSVAIALVAVILCAGVGLGGWYAWTRLASAQSSTQSESAPQSITPMSNGFAAGETPAERAAIADSASNDWKRLREQRLNALPSQHAAIIAALEQAETKYPSDYRFPYERAKLSIKGIVSHHQAFSALASAGKKAIDAGKANEMMDTLLADKDGEFWKLARGHHEWHAVVEALRNRDKTLLESLHD